MQEQQSEPVYSASPPFASERYSGGNGLSKETAVVLGAKSSYSGVPSEYAWIRHHYPGSKPLLQSLTPWDNEKRYDIIEIATKDGDKVVLWFDISEMYK